MQNTYNFKLKASIAYNKSHRYLRLVTLVLSKGAFCTWGSEVQRIIYGRFRPSKYKLYYIILSIPFKLWLEYLNHDSFYVKTKRTRNILHSILFLCYLKIFLKWNIAAFKKIYDFVKVSLCHGDIFSYNCIPFHFAHILLIEKLVTSLTSYDPITVFFHSI